MRLSNVKEIIRQMGSNADPRLAKIIVSMAEEMAEQRQQIINLIGTVRGQQEAMILMYQGFSALMQSTGEQRKSQHVNTTLHNAGVNLLSASNPKNADVVASEAVSHEATSDGDV